MVIQHKTYTNEEFWEFAQRPENQNKRLELIDGMIHEKGGDPDMAPSGKINTIIAPRILHFLSAFVIQHNLGYVVGADSGFDLGPGIIRQPDTGFIVKERVTDLDGNTFAGAPDLDAVGESSPHPKSLSQPPLRG